ncbi:hypothetical protein UFOVP1147_28 [uncultured Caudovirales phage]|uniref:Uncharacterized protein n=1 Tax=uncultured Caudovirales phage TaxID=2100421 RepID=A0A6J5QYK5_9CAUD|nr:hypothetical protein UFOVP484_45 [uncultured Caudovirales phage]CAB4163217.1 hypothetical protein UFOVP808_3 [uncultured Caudovirales phage]CAB4175966.1 hypothetical protein UFOVP994_24 [uncultured Caudovirales phage]CAB4186481.1 hypothetical protein UFOVP1147_28 [uncultured Caudovirales phage]CAB4217406.1 hypothetical protein UFOVP1594_24 [uncultured Caudovirales phage]
MKKTINAAAGSVTFSFDGLTSVTLKMSEVTSQNRAYAELHGMAARIGDNAAIQKSPENGFVVTESMRREAVIEMVEHYISGSADWNLRVSARKPAQNPTILAIAGKLGISYTEAEAEIQRRMLAELS